MITHHTLLYQPDADEITAMLDRATAKHASLKSRAEKAKEIVLNGIGYDQNQYAMSTGYPNILISSQAAAGKWYKVIAHDRGRTAICTCPDYAKDAPAISGSRFCKHKLAWYAYRHIIRDHLNALLSVRILHPVEMFDGTYEFYFVGMSAFAASKNGETYQPINYTDTLALSMWLHGYYSVTTVRDTPTAAPIAIAA